MRDWVIDPKWRQSGARKKLADELWLLGWV